MISPKGVSDSLTAWWPSWTLPALVRYVSLPMWLTRHATCVIPSLRRVVHNLLDKRRVPQLTSVVRALHVVRVVDPKYPVLLSHKFPSIPE